MFIINPQVIHETIDGETIIIDLASGTYYSLRGSGPDIWNALVDGHSPDAVAEHLTRSENAAAAEIESAVAAFVQQLETEGLISRNGTGRAAERVAGFDGDAVFVQPRLDKYTDVQDIILLDPVHEVGEGGWPDKDLSRT